MADPNDIDASWLTVDGQIISPAAPAGGGGAGSFRIAAGTVGVNDPLIPELPSPDAPAARYMDPAIPLDAKDEPEEKINPPPVTVPGTTNILKKQDDIYDIDVDAVVLSDKVDTSLGGGGDTEFSSEEMTVQAPNFHLKDDGTIASFDAKFVFKGRMTIQVVYASSTERKETSAYGRGTTENDIKNGDKTVAFHESCHVADYQAFIKDNPLPMPTLKIGMTPKQYHAERTAFEGKYKKWNADILSDSNAKTDEVGKPTKSQFLKQQAAK